MAKKLHLYMMSNPNQGDGGVMATEAAIVRDFTPIMNPTDFVAKVMMQVVRLGGGEIDTLVISGHGWSNHVTIGTTQITVDNFSDYSAILSLLRKFFAKDAVVTFWECRVGQVDELLKKFSALWGGIKVQGWTGDINVWQFWYFEGMNSEGDQVICLNNACSRGHDAFDPRLPRGLNAYEYSGPGGVM